MTKLTDRRLAQLLGNIDKKYKSNPDVNDLNNFIYYSMQPGGPYADLHEQEKETVWRVLDIYMELKGLAHLHSDSIRKFTPSTVVSNYDWGSYPSSSGGYHTNTFIYINTGGGCGHHSHGCGFGGGASGCGKDEFIFVVVAIMIAIVAAIALLGVIYLAQQILNDVDRIWYDEGRLQAVVSLTFMAGSAAAMGMLMNTLLTGAFAGFLLTVGFANPLTWAIFTVVCVAAIATAPVNRLVQVVQDKAIELLHPNALEPTDPYRFALTDSEAKQLDNNGIDPLRVRCSIAVLHASLEGEETNRYSRNALFSERSSRVQSTLDTIRGLRDGSITHLPDSTFNCRKPSQYNIPVAVLVDVAPSAPSEEKVYRELPAFI